MKVKIKYLEQYEVKSEIIKGTELISVYSKIDGGYIGRPVDVLVLENKGIRQIQKAKASDNVCCIGFNPDTQSWYGWSHRAMYGFKIGDEVKAGDCCNSSGYTADYIKKYPEEDGSLPIGFKAKTLEDAKRMAIAFADSVG